MEPTNTFDSAEFYKRKRLREEVLAQQMEQRHASVSRAIRKANTDMLLDKTVGLLKWAIPVAAAYCDGHRWMAGVGLVELGDVPRAVRCCTRSGGIAP